MWVAVGASFCQAVNWRQPRSSSAPPPVIHHHRPKLHQKTHSLHKVRKWQKCGGESMIMIWFEVTRNIRSYDKIFPHFRHNLLFYRFTIFQESVYPHQQSPIHKVSQYFLYEYRPEDNRPQAHLGIVKTIAVGPCQLPKWCMGRCFNFSNCQTFWSNTISKEGSVVLKVQVKK